MPRALASSVSLSERRPEPPAAVQRPTREQAMEAIRTLIRWAGDDPSSRREVLTMIGTPGGAKLDNV